MNTAPKGLVNNDGFRIRGQHRKFTGGVPSIGGIKFTIGGW